MPNNVLYKQSGSEDITVSSTAIGFTTTLISGVEYALCQVETNPIRIDSFNDPTASVGIKMVAGSFFKVRGQSDIAGFKAIATGSNATLHVQYFKVEAVYPYDL